MKETVIVSETANVGRAEFNFSQSEIVLGNANTLSGTDKRKTGTNAGKSKKIEML